MDVYPVFRLGLQVSLDVYPVVPLVLQVLLDVSPVVRPVLQVSVNVYLVVRPVVEKIETGKACLYLVHIALKTIGCQCSPRFGFIFSTRLGWYSSIK